MVASKEQVEARAAARFAVGTFARYPSDRNAASVQKALRRLRELTSVEMARRRPRVPPAATTEKP